MREPNAVWDKAVDRFRGAYGCDVDLANASDRAPFLELLEVEVRSQIEGELAEKFSAGAERMRRVGAAR